MFVFLSSGFNSGQRRFEQQTAEFHKMYTKLNGGNFCGKEWFIIHNKKNNFSCAF